MLTLHHARPSVASAKVRLVLSEKELPWVGHVLELHRGDQHRPEYRALNPRGVVPTLVHDERVVIESTVIMHYLDDVFSTPALLPSDPYGRALARLWTKTVDERLHPACVTLTFALAFRRAFANKTPDEIEAAFRTGRDAETRERMRVIVTKGLDAPQVPSAVATFDAVFGEMEEVLGRSTFLAGEAYTLADAAIAPYVLRAQMLGLDGFWVDERPRLSRWFERLRTRPSFGSALVDVMTDADRQRLTVAPEESWPRVREILGARA